MILRLHELHPTTAAATNDTIVAHSPSCEQSPSRGTDGGAQIGDVVVVAKVEQRERTGEKTIVFPCVAVEVLANGQEAAEWSSCAWCWEEAQYHDSFGELVWRRSMYLSLST
jgi:hypothetical protein